MFEGLFTSGADRDAAYEANARTSEALAEELAAQGNDLAAAEHRNFAENQRSRIGKSGSRLAFEDMLSLLEIAPAAGSSRLAITAATARQSARALATQAERAAFNAALNATKAGARNGMAVAVITKDGRVFIGYSTKAAEKLGKARTPNGRIKDMAERAQQKLGSGCGGDCGEVDAISQAIKAGANLSGATVKAAQIGGRTSKGTGFLQAGTPRSMCDTCASWVPDLIK